MRALITLGLLLTARLLFGQEAWLNRDAAYIISDDERKAFNQLQTDAEREQFIEQFWLRRDPTPDIVENELKDLSIFRGSGCCPAKCFYRVRRSESAPPVTLCRTFTLDDA